MKRNKNIVNLTEEDLRHLVRESVRRVIKENSKSESYARLEEMLEMSSKEEIMTIIYNYFNDIELQDFTDFVYRELEMYDYDN